MAQEQIRVIEYLLYEQKYMELLHAGKTIEAVNLLQSQLSEKALHKDRLHELAQLIMAALPTQSTQTPIN